MIFTLPLNAGTLLANVLYKWLVNGAFQAPSSSGVTQPDATFPIFRIDTGGNPPTGAEELIAYDSTDTTNWNPAGYRAGLAAVASAQNILLASLFTPGPGVYAITPANPPQLSMCRCYGTFKNLSALSATGITITFTLVQVDAVDPTIIYDVSGVLVRNSETNQLVTDRVISASIVTGQLQDVNANAYVDLCRTDYMLDKTGVALPRMRYLMTCANLGAPTGLSLLSGGAPVPRPVTFVLDTSSIKQTVQGTLDISKLVPS